MASGHMGRVRREDSPCQPGAVHTWPEADMKRCLLLRLLSGAKRTLIPVFATCRELSSFHRPAMVGLEPDEIFDRHVVPAHWALSSRVGQEA